MRKIKEVLRLRFELGLGQREIARACSISQGAVHNYLKKVCRSGDPVAAIGRMGREAD
jgi:DNA-directed RNA polymerase specialized sigma24 family protein